MRKCLLFYVALCFATIGDAQVSNVGVFKGISYVQTGSDLSTVIVDPTLTGPTYGGPYGFALDVTGDSIANIAAPTVTGPFSASQQASPAHNGGRLGYNVTDDTWEYGYPNFNDWEATNQAALDTLFPNGTYTFRVNGSNIALNLTGNKYPNNPFLTLTGGTWVNGVYEIAVGNLLGINSNIFTNYGACVDGYINLAIDIDPTPIAYSFYSSSPFANSLAAYYGTSSLISGSCYNLSLMFYSTVDRNTSLVDVLGEAAYIKMVNVTILAIPAHSTPSFQTWQLLKFSPSQRSNSAISGDTASPARDGISNLMKYALNLSPWVNEEHRRSVPFSCPFFVQELRPAPAR